MARGDAGDAGLRARRSAVATALCVATLLVFAAWVVGFVATDRWRATQFLWWVPSPAYLAAALPGAIVAGLFGRRVAPRWRLAAISAFTAMFGAAVWNDVGWRGARPNDGDLSLVHWNASWPDADECSEAARSILARDADVVVISNPHRFFGDGRAALWRGRGYDVVVAGSFAIASRIPLLEARAVDVGLGQSAGTFVLDARATHGRMLTLLAIDLPSSPTRERFAIAADFAARLGHQLGRAPDIVVGDFNITRGSASLSLLSEGMHHAWDDGGRGWSGTWPRSFPALHLDHVFLSPPLSASLYQAFDPGSGAHRAQECHIRTPG